MKNNNKISGRMTAACQQRGECCTLKSLLAVNSMNIVLNYLWASISTIVRALFQFFARSLWLNEKNGTLSFLDYSSRLPPRTQIIKVETKKERKKERQKELNVYTSGNMSASSSFSVGVKALGNLMSNATRRSPFRVGSRGSGRP